jgi:hypothetical protein
VDYTPVVTYHVKNQADLIQLLKDMREIEGNTYMKTHDKAYVYNNWTPLSPELKHWLLNGEKNPVELISLAKGKRYLEQQFDVIWEYEKNQNSQLLIGLF